MLNGRIVFDLLIISIAGWAFVVAQDFPTSFMQEHIGSCFFPSVVCGLLMILMLYILWSDICELRVASRAQVGENQSDEKHDLRSVLGVISILTLLVLYILFIEAIGFTLATMIFLFVAMLVCHATLSYETKIVFSKGYIGLSAVLSVVITLCVHALFVQGFGLSLY